jgi:hypothetical protein
MDLKEIVCEDVDLINAAQSMGWWWALMSTIMNLLVPYKAGNSLLAEQL